MRILCYGAGAVGTYIGGSLALRGHDVTFLETPEVCLAVVQHGLNIEIDGKNNHILHPSVAESLDQALSHASYDVAIFALKSYHTQSALNAIAPFREQFPPVFCLQNGIDNEGTIAAVLGNAKVIPGTLTSSVGRRAAGNIVLERKRGIGIALGHPLSLGLKEALDEAGLNARIFPNAAAMKWSKMLTNLLANASSAILDMSPAEIFNDPALFRMEIHQLREALAVMAALHLEPVDLPGTPVRALALIIQRLPLALARPVLRRSVGSGRGGKMPSFHIDLYNRRGQSEVNYLNGAVVRAGVKTQVATPVNKVLNDTLLALTNGEAPLDMYKAHPDLLLNKMTL